MYLSVHNYIAHVQYCMKLNLLNPTILWIRLGKLMEIFVTAKKKSLFAVLQDHVTSKVFNIQPLNMA